MHSPQIFFSYFIPLSYSKQLRLNSLPVSGQILQPPSILVLKVKSQGQ